MLDGLSIVIYCARLDRNANPHVCYSSDSQPSLVQPWDFQFIPSLVPLPSHPLAAFVPRDVVSETEIDQGRIFVLVGKSSSTLGAQPGCAQHLPLVVTDKSRMIAFGTFRSSSTRSQVPDLTPGLSWAIIRNCVIGRAEATIVV